MMIYVRVHVYGDRHVMLIRGAEHLAHPGEMFRIVDIDIRVAEVQLESSAQVWVFHAACDLFECIGPERIYATKPKQPIGVFRD